MQKIVYIIGASSQVGRAARVILSKGDCKVIALSRKKIDLFPNEEFRQFHLGQEIVPLAGEYEHIVFYFAHDFSDRRFDKENINAVGLEEVINSFKASKRKRIIFLSTPDVHNSRTTVYKSQKMIAESMLNLREDLIARPSLIFSNSSMKGFLNALPKFIPIPVNNSRISPIVAPAFAEKLLDFGFDSSTNGIVLFIGTDLISVSDFLKRQYGIYTFRLPNILWLGLVLLLKLTQITTLFFLSERIMGYIYLKDIDLLHEDNVKKVVVPFG